MQVQQRVLKDKEMKIRKALDRLRRKRQLLGRQRRRGEFPVVSVVGYTNCGERFRREAGAPAGGFGVRPRARTAGCRRPNSAAGSPGGLSAHLHRRAPTR